MQTINLSKYNTSRNIKNFWNEVLQTGIKIAEYKDQYSHYGFYVYNGKTYFVDMDEPGKISKETPNTWKTMVLNLQDDD